MSKSARCYLTVLAGQDEEVDVCSDERRFLIWLGCGDIDEMSGGWSNKWAYCNSRWPMPCGAIPTSITRYSPLVLEDDARLLHCLVRS